MKYLKTWMGVVESSGRGGMGDDSGYPERKFELIESMDDLVRSYCDDAEYYHLEKRDVSHAVKAARELTEQCNE